MYKSLGDNSSASACRHADCRVVQTDKYNFMGRGTPKFKVQENKMKTRKCPHCQTVKSLDDFYKWKSKPNGLSTYCKTCENYKSRHKEVDLPVDELAYEGEKWISEATF